MGRHFEVRAKSMQATAAKKSALNMRASKEVYMAAKSGVPDPSANLALRSVIEKWKSQGAPKEVIDRAIKKAAGGEMTTYISGRYEAFGPGGTYIVVDALTDNVNRAISEIRAAITKKDGKMTSVIFNFTEFGNLVFKAGACLADIEETLILGDVDLQEIIDLKNGMIQCLVNPSDLGKARDLIKENFNVEEFELAQIMLIPNETVAIADKEEHDKLVALLDVLDELEDVQDVYHNCDI